MVREPAQEGDQRRLNECRQPPEGWKCSREAGEHGYTDLNIPIKANGTIRFRKRRDSPSHAVEQIVIEFEDGKIKSANPSLESLRMKRALEP